MAAIGFGSSYNEQLYRPGIILESELATPLAAFRGEDGSDCAFPVLERQGLGRGSNVKLRFSGVNHNTIPLINGQNVVGNEQNISTEYEDSMELRYFGFSDAIENEVVEQNLVSWSRRSQKLSGIALLWAELWETWTINQLVGNTLVNTGYTADYAGSGGNIVTAMDSQHTYWAPQSNGTATGSDANVAAQASAVLDTRVIDDLVTRASSRAFLTYPIAPCDTPFGKLYVLVCHPMGYQSIIENSSGSDLYDITRAAIQGGMDLSMSPLVNAEGFIYKKTLVIKSDFCPQGITGGAAQANTRVAAFFGARAGHWLFGEGYTDGEHLGYKEHDVLRRTTMLTDTVAGFKRTIVNGLSWSSFRVVHYTPA